MHVLVKKFFELVLPPVIVKLIRYIRGRYFLNSDLKTFWSISTKTVGPSIIDSDLKFMVDVYLRSESYRKATIYWNYLNIKNLKQLFDDGYSNFKQTIAKNYFTFVTDHDSIFFSRLLVSNDLEGTIELKEIGKKHSHFTYQESFRFNYYTILLNHYGIKKYGPLHFEEPNIGNPPYIEINGKRVTQDLLNSHIELSEIDKSINIRRFNSILELGAGSGRTAFNVIKTYPHLKYIIADIPPALYIAQRYLSECFKEKSISKFKIFNNQEEFRKTLLENDIIFILPDQLVYFDKNSIDLFLAIDCLHEMTKERIKYYFNVADKISNYFYFKCWKKTEIPFDFIKLDINSYPVKNSWKKIFHKDCDFPDNFFHSLYKL